jgi:hypothetical protein
MRKAAPALLTGSVMVNGAEPPIWIVVTAMGEESLFMATG